MNTFTVLLVVILAIAIVLIIQVIRIVKFRMKYLSEDGMSWLAVTFLVLTPFEKGHEHRNVRSIGLHYYSILTGYTIRSINQMYWSNELMTTLRDDDNKLSFAKPLLEKEIEEELIRRQNCCAVFIKDFITPTIVDKLFDISDSANQYFALAYHIANEIRDDIDNDGRLSPYSAHIRKFAEDNSIDIDTLVNIAHTVITKQKHEVVELRIKSKGE